MSTSLTLPQPGMWLRGTVRKIVPFGVFVDIGLPQHGLIHASELSDQAITPPQDIVHIGDQVHVRVVHLDRTNGWIGLSMRELP